MSGILNTGLEFWQLITGLIVLVLSVVAIRVSFKFDVNQFLESRRTTNSHKLMNACPHVKFIETAKGDYGLQSTYVSPPGTIQWQCQRCGHLTYDDGGFERRVEYYLKNLDEYRKDNDKFIKLLRKTGLL